MIFKDKHFYKLLLFVLLYYGCNGQYLISSNLDDANPKVEIVKRSIVLGEESKDDDNKPTVKPKDPVVYTVNLKTSHRQVIVDWAGEGSHVIVCVSKDSNQNKDSSTTIFFSYDYGSTFINKTNDFKFGDKYGIIDSFYKNDKFVDRFIFVDKVNKYLFVTSDYGHTIRARRLEFLPSEISMHPTDSRTFFVIDKDDQFRKLWVTTDFGETWKVLSLYVVSYFWSKGLSSPTLYVERGEPGDRHTVISFDTFDSSESIAHKTISSDVKYLDVKEDFLFVVKDRPILYGETSHQDTLQLWISFRGGSLLLASFPNDLTHQHYYVADVSNGQIMVCVHHGTLSNLYVSSVPTSPKDQIKFSLSLERIFFFAPNVNWKETWISKVSEKPFADLHRVDGIRGVFIASQVPAQLIKSRNFGPENITSLISFDQGSEWRKLTPPSVDNDGRPIHCDVSKNCSLLISQELALIYPETQLNTILTSKSAPGMILSSGTVGSSLKHHPGLFLSNDAGATWHQMMKGNYLYAFGDHGGIMVVVERFRNTNAGTNEILYSIDEGETWHAHQFFSEKIRVYGLMTEPGENTTIFTIFGSKFDKHEWMIITVNMGPVFDRSCGAADYKMWTPFDATDGRSCVLGSHDIYERRAPKASCLNGIDYDRPISSETCPCDRSDYECDFGFVSVVGVDGVNRCVKDVNDVVNPLSIPASCRNNAVYNRTQGYRKIPGDLCRGGEQLKFDPKETPCPVKEEMEFLLVSNKSHIFRYNLLNPTEGLIALPLPNLHSVIALDFHLKNNCLYWSDFETKKILRQCLDGQHRQEVIIEEDIDSVEGLALDWVSDNLYFTDGTRKMVEMVKVTEPLSFNWRKKVIESGLERPRAIALHITKGFLFVTDWSDEHPKIVRAHLDGSNLKILFGVGTVGWPNGITVDLDEDRIIWVDAKRDYIGSANLDGGDFKKIISGKESVPQPFSVAVYKNFLFWDDWASYQIYQAEKSNGLSLTKISSRAMVGLVDLKVFGHQTQSTSNMCGEKPNKCRYFCVGKPENQYKCMCPSWLKSVKNGNSETCLCEDDSEPLASGACIAKKNVCSEGFFHCTNGYCIPQSMVCNGDNDCGDHSDEPNSCEKSFCDASSWECKNGHCISPAWRCDTDNDCGDHSDEENCDYIACTDAQFTCNNKRCIDRNWVCDMQDDCRDGSDETNCTNQHPAQGNCRSGLQFQCESSGVCLPISWRCDGEIDCVDSSDEKQCESHKCSSFQFQCTSKRCIYRSWVCDGDEDCDDGIDEKNCSSVPDKGRPSTLPPLFPNWNNNNTCHSFQFKCGDGNCVPFWWYCDGTPDCLDGTDEASCSFLPTTTTPSSTTKSPHFACRESQMECANGECIWESWVCDGEKDCAGGEDEKDCSGKQMCPADHFRCWHTEGCVEVKRRCDGKADCADGSDELGCSVSPSNSSSNGPLPVCPTGYFSCDGGGCIPESKKCDRNNDCIDLTDEKSCSGGPPRVFQVMNLKAVNFTNTTLTFSWEFNASLNDASFEFLSSCIVKAAFGNPNAWQNGTWIKSKVYTFDHLLPSTEYVLKVYVRENKTQEAFPAVALLTMATEEGVPSPPMKVQVNQVSDRFLVTWEEAHSPNGHIISYKIFVSPPIPADMFVVEGNARSFLFLPSQLQQSYTVWMTCSNSKFESQGSDTFVFTPSTVDQYVKGLSAKSKSVSEVFLVWESISGVDGYMVSYSYPENDFLGFKFQQNVSKPEIQLHSLSPALNYIFKVRAFKGPALGPSSSLEVEMPGAKLPPLLNIKVFLSKSAGSSVNLTWDKPHYKENKTWQYEILWGKTMTELKRRVNVTSTTNSSLSIRHLEACEVYLIVVMISGPIGYGPASQIQAITGIDPLAPPKEVSVFVFNNTMNITWKPPCTRAIDDTLRYLISITETNLNKTSSFDLPSKPNLLSQNHSVELHFGGVYRVSIRTYLKGSRSSRPIIGLASPIPPPFELTFNPSDASFFWRHPKDMPPQLITKKHSYMIYLTRVDRNQSAEPDITVEVGEPPYRAASVMTPGQVYYASIAFKDTDGYMSQRTQFIQVEKPIGDSIVVSPSSMVGVAVSVTVVVLALVLVVGWMALRHRRLARSFEAFANSHYDRSQGTTHITTDHNLDDDDSPMIRGFSDDEPLVIA